MRTALKDITEEKENGRVYTPSYIVSNILDLSGYYGNAVLKKHIIDNSCGDGAFLREIVKRYCEAALKNHYSTKEIAEDLSIYIHGIEIDNIEKNKCVKNVSDIAEGYSVYCNKWDIICDDTLTVHRYDGKMDYVVGNPPYVRVHNLGDSFDAIKQFSFAQNGMTDLFIVFYEIGLNMLSENGVLGYITPSSFFNSLAGSYMRKSFVEGNKIKTIVDLKHFQAFDATTYTTIVILQNKRNSPETDYYQFDEKNLIPYYVDSLSVDDYYIGGNFYFSQKEKLNLLKQINSNEGTSDVEVKNGYATLCDDVFIGDFDFDSTFIIPVIKSSKGIKKKVIFPYDKHGHLIPESTLKQDSELYKYLTHNKEKLTKRSNEKEASQYWYAFGRSQAINDTYKDKVAINSLLRDENDLKFVSAPAGVGVYGGLYIIGGSIPTEQIIKVLKNDEFMTYVSLLGKYKSGGYYTFSSKDVKKYVDYKLAYNGGLFA